MKREELLDIPLNEQPVQGSKKSGFFRQRLTLVSLVGFVFFLGVICALALVQPASKPEQLLDGQIINRGAHQHLMQQYSRVLSVEVTPNGNKMPKEGQFQKKIQSENMVLNFYPISKKPQIIAIEVIDQQEKSLNKDISEISYQDFSHEVHKPLNDIYFLVLDKQGQFSKLIVDQKVSENQVEKIKHIVQQYTPELDSSLYKTPKQYIRATKLGQAKVAHEKVHEDSDKIIVKHSFNGEDIAKTSSFQNLNKDTYQFEQTHHFSKAENNLMHSDLHENYKFETEEKDMFMLGMNIQTHQKLELLKTKEISQQKQQELMKKYYALEDHSKQVLTLTPNEIKHTNDFEFAQSVKDQLFPDEAGCPVKERHLEANDNIQMLTNQTFTVYNHPVQSFLGFSFQIIDEISIYLDLTNQTLIFDNSLVLQIQRDSCFKQFTLIEFTLPMTTNFTFDLNYIEASAEAWLENLEDFFTGIYDKFQDFLKKIKAEGIHSNSTWTGIDEKKRELSLKSDLDKFEQDLNQWNEKIIDTLSHTSKQYHYSKPISYEYNLEFYGITLQFSFGFTFGLDGSYTDNLLDLYTYDKQVLLNYIDLLVQDYQTDMEQIQSMWKNLTALLAGCMNSEQLTKEEQILKNWECAADDFELDYVCKNQKNEQQIHITKTYHDYMQMKRKNLVPNQCITSEITQLEQQIQDQLKKFYSLRQTQFWNLINLTYIPQFHGDVYITGYVKVTLVPWLNKLAMSISVSGDLLNAVADLSLQVDVKPFFSDLIKLVQEDISSYQFLQNVESSVGFNFNFDVQVVNVTLTWTADTAVVDFVLDVAEVMKNMWSTHRLRQLPASNSDVSKFEDVFSDAATKFEQGLEKVVADIYCEFFTSASGIAEAFAPETVPLYQFLWASAGCSLPSANLQNFSTSMIQCSYTPDFKVVQLWDPSKYSTSE